MDSSKIEILLYHVLERIKNGLSVEENKIELKRQWYDFNNSTGPVKRRIESEFLKDIVSIANTPGPDGYLIIGIDEKTGDVTNSPISNSGITYKINLYNMTVKYVDFPVNFELTEFVLRVNNDDKIVSVFVIPPSINKPHVITNYVSKNKEIANYIPIKKATGIFPASRSDIEFMYYDRKNIVPEYSLELGTYKPRFIYNTHTRDREIEVQFQILLENNGIKPITIVDMKLHIFPSAQIGNDDALKFSLFSYADAGKQTQMSLLRDRFIKVGGNEVEALSAEFVCKGNSTQLNKLRKAKKYEYQLTAKDIKGNKYKSKILKHGK